MAVYFIPWPLTSQLHSQLNLCGKDLRSSEPRRRHIPPTPPENHDAAQAGQAQRTHSVLNTHAKRVRPRFSIYCSREQDLLDRSGHIRGAESGCGFRGLWARSRYCLV